jgi:hypothetical protein
MTRPVLMCLLAVVLVACDAGGSGPAVSVSVSAATSISSSEHASTTIITAAVTSTTTIVIEETRRELPHLNLRANRGVFAPTSGFVVGSTPYRLGLLFPGSPLPDSVEVNGVLLAEQSDGHVYETDLSELDDGENLISVVVRYNGVVSHDILVPVTYAAGAEDRLGWVTAADAATITVDYTEWDSDREFPGPQDFDPGVLSTLDVSEDVKVIVSSEQGTGYDWFVQEVNGGYANLEAIEGLEEWNPNGIYPYTITVHNNAVVQLWMIPLG